MVKHTCTRTKKLKGLVAEGELKKQPSGLFPEPSQGPQPIRGPSAQILCSVGAQKCRIIISQNHRMAEVGK